MVKCTYCGERLGLLERSYGDHVDTVCQACEADWKQYKTLANQKARARETFLEVVEC